MHRRRVWLLGAGIAGLYAAAVLLLLAVVPGPRSRADCVVIGTLATLAALAALFVLLTTSGNRMPDLFFRKRRR